MGAIERDAIITRGYSEEDSGLSTTQMRQGKLYRGKIRLVISEDMERAVVEEPLPAGVKALSLMPELENPLIAYQRREEARRGGISWTDNPVWLFDGHSIEDDRILLYAEHLPAGAYTIYYTVQAGLPGTFAQTPATLQSLDQPDIYAQTKGTVIEIMDR